VGKLKILGENILHFLQNESHIKSRTSAERSWPLISSAEAEYPLSSSRREETKRGLIHWWEAPPQAYRSCDLPSLVGHAVHE
jgi:hypothetical protein